MAQTNKRDRNLHETSTLHSQNVCKSLFAPLATWDLFYKHGLTLNPAWIGNYIYYKVWDEIIYPFLNFNGAPLKFGNR